MSKLSYKVYCENQGRIEPYDIFESEYWEREAIAAKKETNSREEWKEDFRLRLMAQYWSRCEYELLLVEWPACVPISAIDEIQQEIEDYEKKYGHKLYRVTIPLPKSTEKIDIYDQLMLNKEIFFDYVWKNI